MRIDDLVKDFEVTALAESKAKPPPKLHVKKFNTD
jgi:hypothetical protein